MIASPKNFRLSWSGNAWEELRPLLLDRLGYLIGTIRWRTNRAGSEAMVDAARIVRELPRGDSLPSRADHLIAHVEPDPITTTSVAELLTAIGPQDYQSVIAVVLSRAGLNRWDGVVWERGKIYPLAGFRVAGPGQLYVEREATGDLTVPTEGLFSRLCGAVGQTVFHKLRRATVTQVGASRNGTLSVQLLAGLGVERIRLCDGDFLGVENLDGMPGVSRGFVGRPKSEAVAEMLLRQRDDLGVLCCHRSLLEPATVDWLKEKADLLVTCVDNEQTRVAASIHAQRMLIPHLDLSTSVSSRPDGSTSIIGDARLFLPSQGCSACAPGLTPEEREQVLYRLAAPHCSLERGEEPTWSQQRLGSLVTINAATVAAGVQSWLDLLAGTLRTSFWQRLDWAAGEGLQTRNGAIGAADDCPFCHAFDEFGPA